MDLARGMQGMLAVDQFGCFKRHMASPEDLQRLFPKLLAWARKMELEILSEGEPLQALSFIDAMIMGVSEPGRVRLKKVSEIPLPDDEELAQLATEWGVISGKGGITFGHGILIQEESWNHRQLIAHELVHVAQHEALGMEPFLQAYVADLANPAVGYHDSPFEVAARGKSSIVAAELLPTDGF